MTLRRIQQPEANQEADWGFQLAAGLARSGLGQRTVRTYRYNIERFARCFETKNAVPFALCNLSELDLLSYRQRLIDVERLKPATINQRLQALRWLCRWACREGVLEEDPSRALKSVRVPRNRQPAALTEPEVHALLRMAGSAGRGQARRNYAIVQLLLQTGLRVGEAVGLRLEDVYLQARSGHVQVRFGKGEKERQVPLNASARRALRLYLDTRPEASPEESLFLTRRGDSLSERSLQAMIHSLARRANLTRIPVSPHALRHTFALSYLQRHPGQLVELAHLLGHDSLDTTAIYTQPSAEDLAEDLEHSPLNLYG